MHLASGLPIGGDERLERVGIDRATRDELRDGRDAAAAGALEGERGILRDERLDAQPDHRRQILIGGVLGVRQERARDVPAGRVVQALQRRRQVEPHDRRSGRRGPCGSNVSIAFGDGVPSSQSS